MDIFILGFLVLIKDSFLSDELGAAVSTQEDSLNTLAADDLVSWPCRNSWFDTMNLFQILCIEEFWKSSDLLVLLLFENILGDDVEEAKQIGSMSSTFSRLLHVKEVDFGSVVYLDLVRAARG